MPNSMHPRTWVQKTETEIITTHSLKGDMHTYKEDHSIMAWQILNEQKNISGYQCQKATTHYAGRNYTAWFTTEIPYLDGPYKFQGLPGFIVKVMDDQKHFVFELNNIRKATLPIFTRKHEKITTIEDYFKKEKMVFHNYANYSESVGIHSLNTSEEEIKKKEDRVKKRYNPIERIAK